jgi:hypothetical protein
MEECPLYGGVWVLIGILIIAISDKERAQRLMINTAAIAIFIGIVGEGLYQLGDFAKSATFA